ncbi:hypothetical protein Misp04_29740 [Micromonospora sp. NBRC 101691]|nr:hypothetical protein Misp04_29740 [Micromonospora sp. NBRC 101691]
MTASRCGPFNPASRLSGSDRAGPEPAREGTADGEAGADWDGGISKRACIAGRVYAAGPTLPPAVRPAAPRAGAARVVAGVPCYAKSGSRGPLLPPGRERPAPVGDTAELRNACAPGRRVGILDGVFGQCFCFYYGSGSPAAAGRA